MKHASWMVSLVLAALCGAASAQNMKPGLWEVTQKLKGNAELEQTEAEIQKEMAGMSPAERKEMEAMMGGVGVKAGTAGGGMTLKVCMTKEMVERNDMPTRQGDCRTTQQSRSGNTMKMVFTCTNPTSSGDTQVTVVSPESFRSVINVSSQEKGKTEKVSMEGTGKWLSADCGSVKPMAPKR